MIISEILNFVHFIGLALGLGGVTILSVISAKSEKDKNIGKVYNKIASPIVKLIWTGLILLVISGVFLMFFHKAFNYKLLIIKHILVVWIMVIGIFISLTSEKVSVNSPIRGEKPKPEFFAAKRQLKTLSTINLILWYVVSLVSVFV